ncbi:MAG: Transposase [Microgenomates group bacterium GW2011_GWA2_44_7]|nr:MAG: Transposase [Microgenomates group bacterium GW2011_GWA2_44_7]
MPTKNSRKAYLPQGYYHIYNRGLEKRDIFLDEQDYAVFLGYIKTYLSPKDTNTLRNRLTSKDLVYQERQRALKELSLNNFFGQISLLAYCLMPNHFHLLINQKIINGIDKFLNSLGTRYVMYFNRKYKRVGHLFQGVYKAVLAETNEQLLYLTKYIHRNPAMQFPDEQGLALIKQPSSYLGYLGKRKTPWIDTREILSFFSKSNPQLSYENFVNQSESPVSPISGITLDEE